MAWGMTIPSLYDRSLWLPMALAAICWVGATKRDGDTAAAPPHAGLRGPALPTKEV